MHQDRMEESHYLRSCCGKSLEARLFFRCFLDPEGPGIAKVGVLQLWPENHLHSRLDLSRPDGLEVQNWLILSEDSFAGRHARPLDRRSCLGNKE